MENGQGHQKIMTYDCKIIDQKYHLKGLINQNVCNKLIKFYEDHKHMTVPEGGYFKILTNSVNELRNICA